MIDSVAKRENVPPTIDTPKNCLPFYKNQTPLHKLIIASYCAVPRYPLFCHSVFKYSVFTASPPQVADGVGDCSGLGLLCSG